MLDAVPNQLFASAMKTEIHPPYHTDAMVTCLCGNTFTTGSTLAELKTEVCSVCHPFFTGTQRIIDTGGQVERFRRRAAAKTGKATADAG
jgi:large subunit ribosomal protein L31